ncbi:acyl-CoA dehydrogenase family protein [Streptomyces sp. GbtcB7]|uniref:acyl-CoA dehydrogenase family protein n=1 Tax=Streptomyces sp. GbtcB7 TaxID=2824752 RepID=UPI001C2FA72A|nr:acyl-CoA dehydrogenase family protein [Streptomyces sp. GbtcB7]
MSELADELRDLIGDLASRSADSGAPDDAARLWEEVRGLGLSLIGIAEEHGGSGGTFDDLLVTVQALAENGLGLPIVASWVADWVLSHAGRVDDGRWKTVAPADGGVSTTAGRVSGEVPGVPWARHADRLVLCPADGAPVVVNLRHEAVTVRTRENLAGEPRDTVVLDGAPVAPVQGGPAAAEIRDRLALLSSAVVAGAAHGAYRLTKTYVSERHQFDAPLLKLPAVATNLALMRVHLVQADAAMEQAGENTSPTSAAVARVTTAAAATEIARLAHQLHGAMGISREYPLHHYTRRLWAWRDAVASERDWCELLGRSAVGGGENEVWTRLTSVPPSAG